MPTTKTKSPGRKKTARESNLKLSQRDLAFEVIRRSIVLGDTKSGTRINERVIADKLGVSRVPVREAMLCLHGEGLLSKSKCGLEVTPMSHEDIEHQAEFRVIVECAAVRLVAKRLTPEYSERLQEEVARQAVLLHEQNWRAILESDLYFHELLLNATQNPFLMRLSGSIALGLHYCGTERDNYATVDEHREILEAVIAGDADLAVRLMHLHIDSPSAVDARLATPPIHRDEQSDA